MAPIRGQVLRVSNPGLDRFFPGRGRPGGRHLHRPPFGRLRPGGTADEGAWDTEPDPGTAAAILRRCSALEPRLADAEVLGHGVGLRPGRPEVRLEREAGDGLSVVHNYGHGGSGVTLSWGCAEEATDLVVDALKGADSLDL
jgi:D-amino-acid oxidase